MGDSHPRCSKCNEMLERGHVPDASYGRVLLSSWAPGDPERRLLIGGIKYQVDELIPLIAYRCPACGYVEFYAGERSGT